MKTNEPLRDPGGIWRLLRQLEAWVLSALANAGTGNPSWKIADWYVDPVHGSDANSGTQTFPVKTIMGGIVAKWGTQSPTLAQTTTIHMLAGSTLGQEYVRLTPMCVAGADFILDGNAALVAVATFNLGTVTAKNRATATLLQAHGFTAAGLDVGQLVVNNVTGSHSTIQAIAGGVATLGQPLQHLAPAYFVQPAEDDTWATGQSVTVYKLPLVNLEQFEPRIADSNSALTQGLWWVNQIYVPDQSGVPGNSYFVTNNTAAIGFWQDCSFDAYVSTLAIGLGTHASTNYFNCAAKQGAEIAYGSFCGGFVNTYELALYDWACADLDVIAYQLQTGGLQSLVGYCYVGAGGTGVSTYPGSSLILDDDLNGAAGAALWGPAGLLVTGDSSVVNRSGGSWATRLLLTGSITMADPSGALTTGTSYTPGAPGVWTDGVSLTVTNLDTHGGLQNPRTGARIGWT